MASPEIESITSSGHVWLLGTAAFVLIVSLLEAWTVSLIYYLRVEFLRKIFPSPHQLIRSHVDYCIMAGLLGLFYVATQALGIVLPTVIVVLICVGAVYNPFPFVLIAMQPDPEAGRKNMTRGTGLMVCFGFLPVTIGFGYTAFAILAKLLA